MLEKLTFGNYSELTPGNVRKFGGKRISIPKGFGLSQNPDGEKDRKTMFVAVLNYAQSQGLLNDWPVEEAYTSVPFYMMLMSHQVRRTGNNITQEYRDAVTTLSKFVKNPFNVPGTYFSRREFDEIVVVKKVDEIFAFSFPLGTMQA